MCRYGAAAVTAAGPAVAAVAAFAAITRAVGGHVDVAEGQDPRALASDPGRILRRGPRRVLQSASIPDAGRQVWDTIRTRGWDRSDRAPGLICSCLSVG
jgi:hypothetical protein